MRIEMDGPPIVGYQTNKTRGELHAVTLRVTRWERKDGRGRRSSTRGSVVKSKGGVDRGMVFLDSHRLPGSANHSLAEYEEYWPRFSQINASLRVQIASNCPNDASP